MVPQKTAKYKFSNNTSMFSNTLFIVCGISTKKLVTNKANIKLYVATDHASYFFITIEPKILYSAKQNPEASPINTPTNEICPIPSVKMPVTKTHPVIIITNAILFFSVNFSLKKITEISITIAGAVYTNTTATLMGIRCKAYP